MNRQERITKSLAALNEPSSIELSSAEWREILEGDSQEIADLESQLATQVQALNGLEDFCREAQSMAAEVVWGGKPGETTTPENIYTAGIGGVRQAFDMLKQALKNAEEKQHNCELANVVIQQLQAENGRLTSLCDRNTDAYIALEAERDSLCSQLSASEEKVRRFYDTYRAIAVDGLGLPDPMAEDTPDEAPEAWHGLLSEKVKSLRSQLQAAQDQQAEYERTFDLRWKADLRAIERWRQGDPSRDFTMPDHADLCVWLLEQLEASGPRPPGDA